MYKKAPRAKFCFANDYPLFFSAYRRPTRPKFLAFLAPFSYLSPVNTVQEVMAVVYYGMKRRHEDATMVHAHSSRSHLIVQFTIYSVTNNTTTSSMTSDAAPSSPGTPTRSRRTLPTPSAGHSSRSQSPAPKSKSASVRRSR